MVDDFVGKLNTFKPATDGTEVTREFILSSTGDALGHIEPIERIARKKGVQAFVLDDFDGVACYKP